MKMTQKERKNTKSKRLYCFVLLFLCVTSTGIYLQKKFGHESGRLSAEKLPDVKTKQVAQKKWAEKLELPGVPNLHKVSKNLYRGAQPSNEGMRQLEKLGIKTIINLRSVHSDRNEIENTELSYEHINTTTWSIQNEDIVQFLKIVTDSNNTPVFVHCKYGADRTGTMCAIYRIAVEGWSTKEAIDEMTNGDFGFHGIWMNLVDYIQNLDIENIRHDADFSE